MLQIFHHISPSLVPALANGVPQRLDDIFDNACDGLLGRLWHVAQAVKVAQVRSSAKRGEGISWQCRLLNVTLAATLVFNNDVVVRFSIKHFTLLTVGVVAVLLFFSLHAKPGHDFEQLHRLAS